MSSTWYYYSMHPNTYNRLSESSSEDGQEPSQPHRPPGTHSHPSNTTPWRTHHHHQEGPSEDTDNQSCTGWQSLSNLEETWRTSWLARTVETMQIKWWHYRTGIGALEESENGVEESEYRRDERLVALSEGRLYHYDS